MPAPVADAVVDWLREEETTGGYETARRHDDRLENFYDASARLLNCHRDEVAFVENATRAWDMAFYALEIGPGDRIPPAECRPAERRVGQACVNTCNSRWSPTTET